MSPFESLIRVAGPVSRETFDILSSFESNFRRWNARINLVAPSTLPSLWDRHVLDSAQLVRFAPSARRWLDLGSGGGFPGLILAILMKEAGGYVDLVESNRKKAGFLQAIVGEYSLPARVHAVRIEAAMARIDIPDCVTARALAPLTTLFELAERALCDGATGLFHKGRDYSIEVEESTERWAYDLVEHRSVIEDDSVVLEVSNLRRR